MTKMVKKVQNEFSLGCRLIELHKLSIFERDTRLTEYINILQYKGNIYSRYIFLIFSVVWRY